MNFVRPFFQNNPLTRPATVTLSTGVVKELVGIFDRENTINEMGGIAVQNFTPAFLCAAEDVPGIDNRATINIHYGYLKDESGRFLTDESGGKIIVTNEFTYYVKSASQDAEGFMELTLSKDSK